MNSGIWIMAEQAEGELTGTTLEVAGEGLRLADQLKEELSAVLLGCRVNQLVKILGRYGTEKIYLAEDPRLNRYDPDIYTTIISGLVREHNPSVFLAGATCVGEDLFPRVAARLRTGLVSNCDKLQITSNGTLLQRTLCYSGKVHATLVCPEARPQMATIQPGAMKAGLSDKARIPSVIPVRIDRYIHPDTARTCVTGFIKANPRHVDITEAERIVTAGRGVEDEEGFHYIQELADLLEASVGGSRIAVDNGWIGRQRLIGQSGKTVSPKLIISCGISGASAHVLGMKGAKTIIAINKDQNSPIMKLADLGVVGNFRKIAPILIAHLKGLAIGKDGRGS
jgi:electron transfer flavoprotein alpha subunit